VYRSIKIFLFLLTICVSCFSQDDIRFIIPTFLGNEQRNFYGNDAPSKLDIIWKTSIGCGETIIPTKIVDTANMCGAGWTGQALLIEENGKIFLIQGAYDYNLRKIDAENGNIIWEYKFDDVIKSTGCIWSNPLKAKNDPDKYVIFQGSRQGFGTSLMQDFIPSYRAISYRTGKELWVFNSKKGASYSRDVDGTALIIDDTLFIGLETGNFVKLNPNPDSSRVIDGFRQPCQFLQLELWAKSDMARHRQDLITESSPTLLRNYIYMTSGSGHVYGYNRLKGIIDFDFFTGSDLNGSAVVSRDSNLLIPVEKQYIDGKGGAMLINPLLHPDSCVLWYYPVGDAKFADWDGGIVGSCATNDRYILRTENSLSAFIGIDGFLYVVENEFTEPGVTVFGPCNLKKYKTPQLVFKYETGPSISTPIFVGNKLIVLTYFGLYLFEHDHNCNFTLLQKENNIRGEATPIAYNNRLYVASRDGYLYCFGEKD
jgi:outer membrane protein assembly factor BamB